MVNITSTTQSDLKHSNSKSINPIWLARNCPSEQCVIQIHHAIDVDASVAAMMIFSAEKFNPDKFASSFMTNGRSSQQWDPDFSVCRLECEYGLGCLV